MNWFKFIMATILFFFLSHYVAVFPHEFSHSIVAWMLALKVHPLNINYGGASLHNILFLSNIDENNNYYLMYLLGKQHLIPIVAAAGPGMNVVLYMFSTWVLFSCKSLHKKPLLFYFIFWLNIMNLGNIFDYIPIRVFTTHGDIGHILFGLNNLSPWWIFIPGTYIVILLYYLFFTKTLPLAYSVVCTNQRKWQCLLLLVLSSTILLAAFGLSGLEGYSAICTFISKSVILATPIVILANLPRWRQVTTT